MADDGAARGRMIPAESGFTAALGRAICARVAAGESVAAVCGDEGMPHRTTVRTWALRDAEFGAELAEARRGSRLAARRRDREKSAAMAAKPLPVKGGSVSTYTAAAGEAICARLANGESLVAIARDPSLPHYGTIYEWLRRHPDFADLYVQARQVHADYLFDEAREVALAATPSTVWVGRLQFDVIRWQTARMAPKKYLERVVAAEEIEAIEAQADAARAAAAGAARPVEIQIVRFMKGPNGQVLVAPPRCEAEEEDWVEAHGRPYDGPR